MSLQKTARESASEQFYRIVRPFWLWPHRLVCVSSRWPHRVCCLNHCSPFPAYQILLVFPFPEYPIRDSSRHVPVQ